MDDLNWGDMNYPRRQTADMTGGEQAAQGKIQSYLLDGTEGYNAAMAHTNKTLEGGYDPRTSDFYKGYRAEAETLRNDSNAQIGRQSQLAGMANSTPATGMISDNNRRIDDMLLRSLGGMYENERNRMDSAANTAGALGSQKFNETLQADIALAKERVIEQMKYDMIYNEALQELLAPYSIQAPIAMTMMGYSPGTWIKPGGESGLTTATNTATGFSSIASSIGSFGK